MMAARLSLHRRPVVSAVQTLSAEPGGKSPATQYVRSRGTVVCPAGHDPFTLISLMT